MNIFLVDCGKLFTLNEGLISGRVSDLQANLAEIADIPIDKQVILTSDGGSLDPNNPLTKYSSALSNDRPLFLFSKSSIECNVVPPNPTPLASDNYLKERLDKYLSGGQSCDSLKLGADLAQDYKRFGEDVLHKSKQLVQDQQYQRDGWSAVMRNLDSVAVGFRRRVATFQELYTTFVEKKDIYKSMLSQFDSDVKILAKIPLSKGITNQLHDNKLIESIRFSKQQGLGITESMRDPDEALGMGNSAMDSGRNVLDLSVTDNDKDFISLLDWIEAQDSQNSLHSLVIQCTRAMEQLNEMFLPRVLEEVDKVNASLVTPGMREIKGLDERLRQLSGLLDQMNTISQEQGNLAAVMTAQQERFMHQGDISVLSDLTGVHQKQLQTLHSNNKHLRDLYNKFAVAKGELSSNLLMRLAWVTHCQKQLYSCDGRLTLLAENLMRVRRRFDILEQINIAPSLYCACLGEIYRRSTFQRRYKHWGSRLRERVNSEKNVECESRDVFANQTGGHFLTTLFRGLESRPPSYVAEGALEFDTDLFEVSNEELITLAKQFPSFSQSLLPVRSDSTSLFNESDKKDAECQVLIISTDKHGAISNPELCRKLEKTSSDLSGQVERNVKLELELIRSDKTNEELMKIRDEIDSKMGVINSERISALENLTELQGELEKNKLESQSLQSIATHADGRYHRLKDEFDTMKVEITGTKMENSKLIDQLEHGKKEIEDKEGQISQLEEELQSLSSQSSIAELNERHQKQLISLREEIERKCEEEAKVALEGLRKDKDDMIHALNVEYKTQFNKIDYGHQEVLGEREEENSKLQARIEMLSQAVKAEQEKVQEEQETGLMYKAEAERDLKIHNQKTTEEIESLRKAFAQTEGILKGEIMKLTVDKSELETALCTFTASLEAGGSSQTTASSFAILKEKISTLELTVKHKDEEIKHLEERSAVSSQSDNNRCVTVALTQFTKGDVVYLYYDSTRNNYLVSNSRSDDYLYFLHPDNLSSLGLSLEPPQKPWCLGVIKDKEFCQARKINNRFKVPEGMKFYRVYAHPYGTARDPGRS